MCPWIPLNQLKTSLNTIKIPKSLFLLIIIFLSSVWNMSTLYDLFPIHIKRAGYQQFTYKSCPWNKSYFEVWQIIFVVTSIEVHILKVNMRRLHSVPLSSISIHYTPIQQNPHYNNNNLRHIDCLKLLCIHNMYNVATFNIY